MSRTLFSHRRMCRFISRHPASLTREDARLVSCPGLLHLNSGIFLSSDDADQFRNLSSRAVVWCQPWIYKRGCQEHCSPTAGCAGLFRGIQPLSPEKTLVWCRALGCSISTAASFLVATTPISFETYQAVRLYGVTMDLSEA